LLLCLPALLLACGDKDADSGGGGGDSVVVADADSDGFADDDDCAPDDPAINPGAVEVCDGVDNDCSGLVDDFAFDAVLFYSDGDGDGHGAADQVQAACAAPEGFVEVGDDCDDADSTVHPGADERCDARDNDCDEEVDEDAVDATVFFADADDDGFGDPAVELLACEQPDGAVDSAGDCDDSDPEVNPGATEVCDGIDNDCDTTVDPFVQVPGDHATVAEAIAAAGSGDELCIAAGTYTELLDLAGKDLTLTGAAGAEATVLDGDGAGTVVTATAGEALVVRGLTVRGGAAESGGGILVEGGSVRVEDAVVEANLALDGTGGGGLAASSATVVLVDSTLRDNEASGGDVAGGGLYAEDCSVTLENSVVMGNRAVGEDARGGGIAVWGGTLSTSGVSVEDNAVEVNLDGSTHAYGGGISVENATVELQATVIAANAVEVTTTSYGYSGGGGLYLGGGPFELVDVVLEDNALTNICDGFTYAEGAALHLSDWSGSGASSVLQDVVVHSNTSSASSAESFAYVYGSPVAIYGDYDLSINSLDITDNVGHTSGATFANSYGGGFYSFETTIDAVHLDIRGNQLTGSDAGYGAAISAEWSPVTVTASVLAGNTLDVDGDAYGGVVQTLWDDRGFYEGRPEGADVVLSNVDIAHNTVEGATIYGGVFHQTWDAALRLHNTTIAHNSATAATELLGAVLYAEEEAEEVELAYVNLWSNATATADWTGELGDLSPAGLLELDPGYTDTSSASAADWDLHPSAGAATIDAGDPAVLDADGTASDLGAYGGPLGSW
jgi:hypothetical protein